jgi:serine/threonine protein kinase
VGAEAAGAEAEAAEGEAEARSLRRHPSSWQVLQPGTTVANYRIERVLGRGGMGVVYEATQMGLGRTVALKIISPELSDDPSFRARFQREGRIQAQLDHPHIITVYEAAESEHGLFIAMRFVQGPTLKELITPRELDPARALRIHRPAAAALDAAHARGLVHRDVKPQNILVGAGDHPFLADFGLTKASEDTHITESGQFIGTLDYISPEQIEGRRTTASSDIYSFGAVLYECLTGRVPYIMGSKAALLFAHISSPPPRVSAKRPELPAAFDAVIATAMAKNAAQRHATATEMVAAAEAIAVGRRESMMRPPPPLDPSEVDTEPTVHSLEGEALADADTRARWRADETPPTRAERPSLTERFPLRGRTAATAGAVALLLVVGAAALGSTAAPEAEKLAGLASPSGAAELSRPESWTPVDEPGATAEMLTLEDAAAVRGERAGEQLLVGTVTPTVPTFLPDALLDRLDGRRPNAQVVRLGDLDAYRYRDLRPRGLDGRLTAFAVPTADGASLVACTVPASGGGSFLETCERSAATLRLPGKDPIRLSTSRAYAGTLRTTMHELNSARASGLERLRAADGARGRARAADTIGDAYSRARRALSEATPGPGAQLANSRLVSRLQRSAAEWRALAAAARGGNRTAYNRARDDIARAESSFRGELAGLRALGFAVR